MQDIKKNKTGLPNNDQSYIFKDETKNENLQTITRVFLTKLGLNNESLKDTPKRFSNMWHDFVNKKMPDLTTFPLDGKAGMVILKDHIEYGFCPHHLLPVRYIFKVGYIPEEKVLGVSKLARICNYVLKDLPLQEDIAKKIVEIIYTVVKPKGAGCVISGQHFCMKMRGVESENSSIVTSFMKGCFLLEPACRKEFIEL